MISEKMKELVAGSSIIRAMFEEGKRLSAIHGKENVFDFSLGNPSAPPPAAVKNSINAILTNQSQSEIHAYMNNSGYEDVRKKIAESINSKHGTKFGEANVVMTVGAAGGLNVILKTIINPGDEVIVLAPYFGEYNNYISNMNGQVVVVHSDTRDFQPNPEELEKAITPRTKAVIINSPNNPTGVIYSEQTLKNIAAVLEEKQKSLGTCIYLISDEPYRQLVYGNVMVPYVPCYYRNTFVAYSFSKSLSLPGERIGYIAFSSEMDYFTDVTEGLNVANRILGFVNAPSLFQRVAAMCIDVNVDMSVYEKNRQLLYDTFIRLGFECVKPEGAFYIFPRALNDDGKAFCQAAKKFNLLLVPGQAFCCPTHFRVAFCVDHKVVERAIPAFEKLAKSF